MVSVFSYAHYKPFLRDAIHALPKKGRGARLRLAETLGCQSSYISQVLNGDAHFSFEQLERAGRFLQLSAIELRFLLLLAHEERAGTGELRALYRADRERILEERKVMKNRFATGEALSFENQARYFSSWHYSAIHVLLTIPSFRDKESIRERLRLPIEAVNEALDILLETGLAALEHGRYVPSNTRFFLGNDSPLISKLHQNWRHMAIMRLDHGRPEDLHYSTVVTLSAKDYDKIREQLVKAIENARETIRTSKEEKLCSFCMDFYEI